MPVSSHKLTTDPETHTHSWHLPSQRNDVSIGGTVGWGCRDGPAVWVGADACVCPCCNGCSRPSTQLSAKHTHTQTHSLSGCERSPPRLLPRPLRERKERKGNGWKGLLTQTQPLTCRQPHVKHYANTQTYYLERVLFPDNRRKD